jgi:hypothetical protein
MPSQTVRISKTDHTALAELSRATGKSMSSALSDAIQAQRRKHLIEASNAAYAKLRKDPKAWKEELEERALWDTTLADGLE